MQITGRRLVDLKARQNDTTAMRATRTPLIGLTADLHEGSRHSGCDFSRGGLYLLKKPYADAVALSGGLPTIIPPVEPESRADALLDVMDGLLVSGGFFDIDPRLYGEKPIAGMGMVKPARTRMEMRLIKKAVRRGIPVLGVCGGQQAINVAFGGTLYQHLPAQVPGAMKHEQKPVPATKPSHAVIIENGSLLRRSAGTDNIRVNSTHHQAVKKVGRGLAACAHAPDGVVEAVERKGDGSFLLGVQWHPEQLFKKDSASQGIFKRFIRASREYRKFRQTR